MKLCVSLSQGDSLLMSERCFSGEGELMIAKQNEQVITVHHEMSHGGCLMQISLNKPKALNALDLSMIRTIQTLLDDALSNASIKIIFLDAVGDKAFCAGGDIVALYNTMNDTGVNDNAENDSAINDKALVKHQNVSISSGKAPDVVSQFFSEEYRLDYTIHTYTKPIIVWGNGFVMGGGMGLYAGATFRVATEKTRISMPELSIGLIPDVGASYFLNKLPPGIGLFLGLTGSTLKACDALQIGLADVVIKHAQKQNVIASLLNLPDTQSSYITQCIAQFQSTNELLMPDLSLHQNDFSDLACQDTIALALVWLSKYAETKKHNSFFEKVNVALKKASPLASATFFEQMNRGKTMALASCFEMELSLALSSACSGEFKEGIRARLIDKDNSPRWKFQHCSEVDKSFVTQQFDYFDIRNLSNPLSIMINNEIQNHRRAP